MDQTKVLVVVDMQNDFIDGSLGTKEAQGIVSNVLDKIKSWNGYIVSTCDFHWSNYLETNEGKHLPVPHCISGTDGAECPLAITGAILSHEGMALPPVLKNTFGTLALPECIRFLEPDYIELVGLCTDVCVVSNAILLKTSFPNAVISVDASCCAGTNPDRHRAALMVMDSCQIEIMNLVDR